jgi:hypothetical protein
VKLLIGQNHQTSLKKNPVIRYVNTNWVKKEKENIPEAKGDNCWKNEFTITY